MIEGLLAKIVAAIFKKAAVCTALKAVATAVEVYSVFDVLADLHDYIQTTNDCHDLSVCGLQVVSGPLSEQVVDRLLNLGNHCFVVERSKNGLYVASSLTPRFHLSDLQFPALEHHSFPNLRKRDFPNLI